jgi:hypothetical protein
MSRLVCVTLFFTLTLVLLEEEDILFDPVDVARHPNGDILILEGRGCTVKRYDRNYEYISSFGQPGQGPGEFEAPTEIKIDEQSGELFVSDNLRTVKRFKANGEYIDKDIRVVENF